MAERLADISTKIANVRQLNSVITAMRGIAGSHAQQSRALLAGVDAYADVVAQAIGQALQLPPPIDAETASRKSGKALILFCAEQGFAGAYSERVLNAAPEAAECVLFIVGARGAALAKERGLGAAWSGTMATRVDAVAGLANDLADAFFAQVATGAVTSADMIFSCAVAGGMSVQRQSLLPVDLRGFARPVTGPPPLTTLQADTLVERLTVEYMFAQLCRAAMRAFAAENEARMLAMSAAKTNVESKLGELAALERRLRQEEITNEIIELSTQTMPTRR
jgi:F-type H+-transporting ATPase subunit gamma